MISDRKSTTLLDDPLPTLETAKKNCMQKKQGICDTCCHEHYNASVFRLPHKFGRNMSG